MAPFPPPPDTARSSQQVYYWEADSRNETEKMKVLFLPDTALRLKNLTSHTRYLVSISAFNAAGDGPRSDPRPGRTHQAGRGTSRLPFVRPCPCGGGVSRVSSCPVGLQTRAGKGHPL